MSAIKLTAGEAFPDITVPALGGGEITLGRPENGHDWRLVVVYRGRHCPVCTTYLKGLNDRVADFNAIGIDVVAVSSDPEGRAQDQMTEVNPAYPVGYDLSVDQMRALGLYISTPRSEKEGDRPFSEPGLFVINGKGNLQIVDISNIPHARPDFEALAKGLKFIRNPDNNYPIRGTHV